jgi:enoyl-CoA hydratase/carnithine racemase
MQFKEKSIAENSLYTIDRIDKLAIIRFKEDSPPEELYKVENIDQYFVGDLSRLLTGDITTRLFIYANNTFSEKRFNEFFKKIEVDEKHKSDEHSTDYKLRLNALARFTTIKHRFIRECIESDKLNIFVLHGSAIGLWLSTILCGDFSIMSADSKFTFPFLQNDILSLGGLTYYLDKYAPKSALDELLLFGKSLSAKELSEWGLINKVFPKNKDIEREAIKIALEASKKSSYYIFKMKNYKRRLNKKLLESLDLERELYSRTNLRRF